MACLVVLAGAGWAPAALAAGSSGAPLPGRLAAAGVISTVAGGVGGPAKGTGVSLGPVSGVSFGAGAVYIADNWAVRKLNPRTGWLTTPAGTGFLSPPGDGGPAVSAGVQTGGVTTDHQGNLVVQDDQRLRVVAARAGTFYGQAMTAGHIYPVAGDGRQGFSGDGGPATAAELNDPLGVAVDRVGNLLIADTGNNRVRLVAARTGTFYGQAMTAGDIYPVAGNGTGGFSGDGGPAAGAELAAPQSATVDRAGNLIVGDTGNGRIRVVAVHTGTYYGQPMTAGDIYTVAGGGGNQGDGVPATSADLTLPLGMLVDGTGNLVFADAGSNRVRVVATSTGTFYGQAMTAGDIYTVAGIDNGTYGFSGDGGPATKAQLNSPVGVAEDSAGNLVVGDGNNYRARVVATSTGTFYGQAMTAGDIYTVAGNGIGSGTGDGGPATHAQLSFPEGLAVDHSGNLVVSDTTDNRVRVVATSTGTFYGQAMTAGDIYTVAGNGTGGFSGDGGPATKAKLNAPVPVAVDGAGNLLIGDLSNHRVRVVAASTGTFYGQAMTAGHIYTVAGDGVMGLSGDGGPATSAELTWVYGVTVDHAGNVVICQSSFDSADGRVRVVAARTGTFYGQAMTAGHIYLVAGGGPPLGNGGPATGAELNLPHQVTVDHAGNLLVADTHNEQVRVVAVRTGRFYGQPMTAEHIYPVAGDGLAGFSGDGGPATRAELHDPNQVAVDLAGNLLIADTSNNRVRVLAARTGTYYGQPMAAGDIYTVAGSGSSLFSGDGGPATAAGLDSPKAITLDGAGNLLIADTYHFRIRQVTFGAAGPAPLEPSP
ncbi:MAG TPA: hypothetical protein VGS19_04510 [Streptosporangiaceae bacterium]|nr:hypothetical protein [Streptosporangiaceae bacterium]